MIAATCSAGETGNIQSSCMCTASSVCDTPLIAPLVGLGAPKTTGFGMRAVNVAVSVELKREYPTPTPKFSHTRIAPETSKMRPLQNSGDGLESRPPRLVYRATLERVADGELEPRNSVRSFEGNQGPVRANRYELDALQLFQRVERGDDDDGVLSVARQLCRLRRLLV